MVLRRVYFADTFPPLVLHFLLMADDTSSPRFQNPIFVRGRTSIILLTPHKVPCRCDNEECKEDDRRVVHVVRYYRDGGWHAEEWEGESRPA